MPTMSEEELKALLKEAALEAIRSVNRSTVLNAPEDNKINLLREYNREQRKQQQKAIKASQDACPHVAGGNPLSTSQDFLGRTCIVWHQLLYGTAPIGICTNCQRVFRPEDADYHVFLYKPSINKLSVGRTPCPSDTTLDENRVPCSLNPWTKPKIDDSSSDPNLWSDEKIDLYIKVQKDLYRMNKRKA